MKERALLDRLSGIGTAAQATIPGFYAWAVTVAPAAWSRGAPLVAKIVAILGVVALVIAIVIERRQPRWARLVSVWGLVATSALVWALAPGGLSPTKLDAPRGVAGMLGWGLFAFSSAGPALPRDPEASRVAPGAPLRPRTAVPKGDGWFILGGAVCAAALQVIGWRVNVPERALLVRLVALATGIAVLGAATQIALARHQRRFRPSKKTRMRRALATVIGLAVLAAVGVALLASGR
jgi:hypothetical protein